ncbi:MAG: MBL fold metallo-hydrolase [Phycisphaeraceae bacterium]|nr:MBL fold metallo-hydrolase [Phycisphaeraceae bacterium]MCW5768565.1 MBL fold metallo-hydrolase [Phycisphaeraceae bacterium]
MLPKPPPREGSLGFLYVPPFRIQGVSVAGETTSVAIPELDIVFDLGECPRAMLPAKYAAISHGHMDHVGALAYFCSQRRFQGMGDATIVCDARIETAVRQMMAGFVELERQETSYKIVPLDHNKQIEIKNNIFLRGFHTEHNCPSMGYAVVERRSKLKTEFIDLPQEKLRELKDRGVEITRTLEIPLVAYLGDTAPGPHLVREDVRKAQIVICECTFFEPDHRERAKVGMHMHVADVAEWLRVLESQALVLIHISRRTNLQFARKRLVEAVGADRASKVLFLMDHKNNRERYEEQARVAEHAGR